MSKYTVDVFNLVGSEHCIEAIEGQKVYEVIKIVLSTDRHVEISFVNVEILTTAFLNTAIGQLYRDFCEDFIREKVSVIHMSASDLIKLKRVNMTAKAFYKYPDKMKKSIEEILGE